MNTRSGWTTFIITLLAVAFIISSLSPNQTTTTTVVIIEEEVFDQSIFNLIDFRGFEPSEERSLREAMVAKFSRRCTEAFEEAGLLSPLEVARTTGFVMRPSRALWRKDRRSLGFVYESTRRDYQSEFSSCWAQAGTVPAERDGWKLTIDGRARVFIFDSAFAGESLVFRRFSLEDVLTHELQHVGGQGKTPGWFGPFTHDLKGFEPHDRILAACR